MHHRDDNTTGRGRPRRWNRSTYADPKVVRRADAKAGRIVAGRRVR